MKTIKIKRSALERIGAGDKDLRKKRSKSLGDVGKPAQMVFENFETILGFRPRLDLISAEPHDPPEMSRQNPPANIEAPKKDPNQKDAEDLAGSSDYDISAEPERVPHEHEKVEQSNKNLKESAKEAPEEPVKEASREPSEEEISEKFIYASQLADIKLAAGVIGEDDRYTFIRKTVAERSLGEIQTLLQESGELYQKFAEREESRKKEASFVPPSPAAIPSAPKGVSTDPLSAILSGWWGDGD